MKKLLFVIVCVFSFAVLSAQQTQEINTTTKRDPLVQFGFGFGFGFFDPADVNQYIDDKLESYMMTFGFTDIILNMSLKATLNFNITRYFDIALTGDYSIAPKFIQVSNGDDLNFYFNKLSPGVSTKFYIPMGSRKRHSFFVAPGLLYNMISFEDYSAENLGARLQTGFSLKFGRTKMQPYISYEYCKASDTQVYNDPYSSISVMRDFDLDYSNVKIGIDFLF